MQIQKFHLAAAGVVVLLVVVIIVATTIPSRASFSRLTLPEDLDPQQCPEEYGSPRPVVLVSMDGFKPEYLHRNRTPTLHYLSQLGVKAPYLLPVYPTKTFTNHYSIVTGLYPESHGIVDNVFYDPTFKALFGIGLPPAYNGSWWGGEPIWNTLSRQGKQSATFFWPGSEADIGGRHPSEYFTYNSTISYRQRVAQVMMWVALPPEKRPAWVSLYLGQPDKQGHATGPLSDEVDEKLEKVEVAIRELMRALAEHELLNCVNILLVSDHGMAQAREDARIDLATAMPNISEAADVLYGASPQIRLKDPSLEAEVALVTRLSTDFEGKLRAFLKTDLPKRLHYAHNDRISPIVLDVTPGYTVKDVRPNQRPDKKQRPPAQGFHGYDNIYPEMAAFFIGYGPDLVQGRTVEAFQNIELYNLMCHLTGVQPAPNNGTWGALHHLLADPPPIKPPTQLEYTKPLVDVVAAGDLFHLAEGCTADPSWTGRERPSTQESAADMLHNLPWGPPTPHSDAADPVLLPCHTHVTGYSQALKVPLWTSFTLHLTPAAAPAPQPTPCPWLDDPRLAPAHMASCNEYAAHENITMAPLFPPRYGSQEVPEEAHFITNAIGITDIGQAGGMVERWRLLTHDHLEGWLALHGPLNVVLGPVFDHDDDGRLDPLTNNTGSVAVPSDMFAVVTRCSKQVSSLAACAPQHLDALAFIYPQSQHSWTPASGNSSTFALLYTARLRDVELLTGLTFFPNLTTTARLALALRTHRELWPLP